ncbi:MAG: cytochrome d ubiquinol oxidase subunit II [Bacilli bacterium]
MTFEFMAQLWFVLLTLVWALYLAQEFFVSGVGMLSLLFLKDDLAYSKLNTSVGTFWDGIQVWLILAVGGTFAAFPHAFAAIFTALYIPVFLLLYVIIIRGISIELIYKSDNLKTRALLKKLWIISSFLLILVLGLYTFNMFLGLPMSTNGLNDSFFSFAFIFNRMALIGALTFIFLALTLGLLYFKLNLSSLVNAKINKLSKVIPIIAMAFYIFLLIGLNTKGLIFERATFLAYPLLWILPVGGIISVILGTLFTYRNMNKLGFTFIILSVILLVFTGYIALMPNFIFSTLDSNASLSIIDAAAKLPTLSVMFYSLLVFLPIVLAYQGYKYYRFWGK